MKKTCCRSTPRCASCPVFARRVVRDRQETTELARLIGDVLARHPRQTLPDGIAAAFAELDRALGRGGPSTDRW